MTSPRLVFVGDSITDAGRVRTDPASLGAGYVSLVAKELDEAVVLNRGIGGDRAVDLERRWATDVVPAAADVLTVYVGVNDTWRRFDHDDPTSAEDFEATYRRLLDAVDVPRTILVEPFLVPVRPEQDAWLEDLDGKRAVVARVGADRGATVVPLHRLMTRAAAEHGAEAIAADGVHPTAAGSRIIADSWLSAYRAGEES